MTGTPPRGVALTVAGVRLAFAPAPGLAIVPPGFEYPPFLGEQPCRRTVSVHVDAAAAGSAGPRLPRCFDTGDGWRLLGDGSRCRAELPDRAGAGEHRWAVSWERPLGHARAAVGRDLITAGTVHHLAQYPLDQILLVEALLDDAAVLIHAAGGETPAGGIAFAGPSGAGKSTLTRLLHGRRGFRFASDDRLFVRATPGGCELHGTPWAGDAGVASGRSTPLRALCFLHQDRTTELRALAPGELLDRLLPVTSLPWFDPARLDAALGVCSRIVESVPCYQLAFRPDADALAGVLSTMPRAA